MHTGENILESTARNLPVRNQFKSQLNFLWYAFDNSPGGLGSVFSAHLSLVLLFLIMVAIGINVNVARALRLLWRACVCVCLQICSLGAGVHC